MAVQRDVVCAELCEDGRLAPAEAIYEADVFLRRCRAIKGVKPLVAWGLFPSFRPDSGQVRSMFLS